MNKLISYLGIKPKIFDHVFIASSADIIGNVTIGKESSIWYQCVLRGDINSIKIGEYTNIQDHTIIHLSANYGADIGDYVTIGHGAIIHGCTIKDSVLVGMGACILDGAVISKNSIVGARSLVTKGKTFEEGMLIMGSPAKAIRKLTDEELKSIKRSALNYVQVANEYYEEEKVDS